MVGGKIAVGRCSREQRLPGRPQVVEGFLQLAGNKLVARHRKVLRFEAQAVLEVRRAPRESRRGRVIISLQRERHGGLHLQAGLFHLLGGDNAVEGAVDDRIDGATEIGKEKQRIDARAEEQQRQREQSDQESLS